MEFLMIARGKTDNTPEQVEVVGKAESQKVWEYYTTGKVRLMYYFANHKGAVMTLNADDCEEAIAIANSFPMVEAGLVEMEVIELAPYTGLERLFNT
jgi:hypothetical protein